MNRHPKTRVYRTELFLFILSLRWSERRKKLHQSKIIFRRVPGKIEWLAGVREAIPLKHCSLLAVEVEEDKRDSKQWSQERLDETEDKANEVKPLSR